jgi:aminopeptidase YwaD
MLTRVSKQAIERAWTDLEQLAGGIGARVAGTEGERRAAALIAAAFAARGLPVAEQTFRWVGWEPFGPPRVEVHLADGSSRQLRAAAMAYTDSTPEGGIHGKLVPAGVCELVPGLLEWPRFAIERDGESRAFIAVVPDGAARPFPRPERQLLLEPITIVGADEFSEFAARLEQGEALSATVECRGRYVPGNASTNVIAEVPSSSAETIVVSAHYDTVASTPGAGDNASGVAGCLALAEHFAAEALPKTLRFIAWGAHEFGLLGSQAYVQELAQRGMLEPIAAALALDILCDGDRLGVWVGGDAFAAQVGALRATLPSDFPVEVHPRGRGETDTWSFAERGIDTAMFLTLPYAHFHLPQDTVESMSRELFGYSVEAARRVIELLLARPAKERPVDVDKER